MGVTYAWFNYYQEGTNKKLLSSNLYLYLDDDTNNVLLQNVYPLSIEEARAGGKYDEKNENFYLRTNGYFWTMSPSNFYSTLVHACEWSVRPTGLLGSNYVTSGYGLRAVINLNSNTRISNGDGTVSNLYIIE